MDKKVKLGELVGARIVIAINIAVYYWCWARNGWQDYYTTIGNAVAIFTVLFFLLLSSRERRYKKESVDELALSNLKRCDSICFKLSMAAIVVIAFLSAILRFSISSEVIGYMLMGLLVCIFVLRTVLFYVMDIKGV